MSVRETEAEALLREESATNAGVIQGMPLPGFPVRSIDTQLSAQKILIADLHSQLAKKEPLLRPTVGKKSSAIAILTRAEADEEARSYKNHIAALTADLNEARTTIKSKDQQIADMDQRGVFHH